MHMLLKAVKSAHGVAVAQKVFSPLSPLCTCTAEQQQGTGHTVAQQVRGDVGPMSVHLPQQLLTPWCSHPAG